MPATLLFPQDSQQTRRERKRGREEGRKTQGRKEGGQEGGREKEREFIAMRGSENAIGAFGVKKYFKVYQLKPSQGL